MSSIEQAVEKLSRQVEEGGNTQRISSFPLGTGTDKIEKPAEAQVKPQLEFSFETLAAAGYLTPESMQGRLAEQYRRLKRPILNQARRKDDPETERANLIAITSALNGEGKTFTAFNLSMSIAMEQDVSVLLVDGDPVTQSLSRLVGSNEMLGLTDILNDHSLDVSDIIVGTNMPKLNMITAGRFRGNPTELLASQQMRSVVNELSGRYSNRIIVFDTAPILMTSQAMVLLELVGQIAMVVEEGQTQQQALKEALAILNKNKAIGLILNNSRSSAKSDYYYGNY